MSVSQWRSVPFPPRPYIRPKGSDTGVLSTLRSSFIDVQTVGEKAALRASRCGRIVFLLIAEMCLVSVGTGVTRALRQRKSAAVLVKCRFRSWLVPADISGDTYDGLQLVVANLDEHRRDRQGERFSYLRGGLRAVRSLATRPRSDPIEQVLAAGFGGNPASPDAAWACRAVRS